MRRKIEKQLRDQDGDGQEDFQEKAEIDAYLCGDEVEERESRGGEEGDEDEGVHPEALLDAEEQGLVDGKVRQRVEESGVDRPANHDGESDGC